MQIRTINIVHPDDFLSSKEQRKIFDNIIYDHCNYHDSSPLLLNPDSILDELHEILADECEEEADDVSIMELAEKTNKENYIPVLEKLIELTDNNLHISI